MKTLVILAAGMSRRYGGLKQLAAFGPTGETLADYAIYDAIRNHFGKIILIIRAEIETEMRAHFESKWGDRIKLSFVIQTIPEGKEKPLGTVHALLCASSEIDSPFVVVNADDFYGADAMDKASSFLSITHDEHALVAYPVIQTLSPHGGVTRALCYLDEAEYLTSLIESDNIRYYMGMMQPAHLSKNHLVSMNIWAFQPNILSLLKQIFDSNKYWSIHGELPISVAIDVLCKEKSILVRALSTHERWFGVTFAEDAEMVKADIAALIAAGQYPPIL